MEPFLIKTINPSKIYTKQHVALLTEAIENIDRIINSDNTPNTILERLFKERLEILKQISKISDDVDSVHQKSYDLTNQ